MKRILLTIFCLLLTTILFAQIKGRSTDEKAAPLRFANVTLLKAADTSFVSSAITDQEGSYSIASPAAGKYLLRFTAIGYKEKMISVDLSAATSKDLGATQLQADVKDLNNVTVQSLRPTITQLPDRMVVGVEGSALAASSTAFDVLARSPGVFIDHEGNIQLNGRSGVTVMLNGKLTYMSARDLKIMLETMSADNIKNIEIITNPSAKYDAEGTSGILNINLKKNIKQGMNGSVFSGYNYNFKQHNYSAGATINYKSGRWSTYGNIDFARRASGREATFTRIFKTNQSSTYFDQVAVGNNSSVGPPYFRIGADYDLNSKHTIGAIVNYFTVRGKNDFLTETFIGNAPKQPHLFIDSRNLQTNKFTNSTVNLHYTGKLDSLGTTISADMDYIRLRSHGKADFLNYYDTLSDTKPFVSDLLYTDIPSGFDIYSAKMDLVFPFKKGQKFETGVKASRVESDNDSRFYFNNNGLVVDPSRTNHFNYREKIYAAYVNFSTPLSKKTSIQAGVRAENTVSRGESITTGQITNRNYPNLFPSVFLSHKASDNYQFSFNYSRRLQRPNYGSLNPFRFYRDPYTYVEGNPYLRPQYAHVFGFTQTIKKIYNVTLSYQLTKDFMSELPRLDEATATTIYYTGNVDDVYNVSLTGIIPIRFTKKWEATNTLVGFYNTYNILVNNQMIENDQLSFVAQSNHVFQLPKEFRLEMDLLYRSKTVYGLYQIHPQTRVNLGVRKSFFNKKLDVTVNAVDIFKGMRLKFDTRIGNNINDFDQYFRARSIGIQVRYHFSSGQKVDVKRRNVNLEEVNRAN